LAYKITMYLRMNECYRRYSTQQWSGAKIKYLDIKIPNSIILKIQTTGNLIYVNNGGAWEHVWFNACSEIKKNMIPI